MSDDGEEGAPDVEEVDDTTGSSTEPVPAPAQEIVKQRLLILKQKKF